MSQKKWFTLFLLIGIMLSASCGTRRPGPALEVEMANPASVYCEQNGGKLDIRTAVDGSQSGACMFPDGSECDEWAYFRGECKPGNASQAEDGAALARAALLKFFGALAEGRYAEAASLYAGSYEELISMNPDVDPGDHAALLQRACTQNGFQCLPVKQIVQEAQSWPDVHTFTVEFENPDGSTFTLNPCCGTEAAPQSRFDFTVAKMTAGDGAYRVQRLPVYVP